MVRTGQIDHLPPRSVLYPGAHLSNSRLPAALSRPLPPPPLTAPALTTWSARASRAARRQKIGDTATERPPRRRGRKIHLSTHQLWKSIRRRENKGRDPFSGAHISGSLLSKLSKYGGSGIRTLQALAETHLGIYDPFRCFITLLRVMYYRNKTYNILSVAFGFHAMSKNNKQMSKQLL